MEDSSFSGNKAVGASACGAAVVAQTTAPLDLRGKVTFRDNLSSRDGGCLCLSPRSDADGGGIACPQSYQVNPFLIKVRYTCTVCTYIHTYTSFLIRELCYTVQVGHCVIYMYIPICIYIYTHIHTYIHMRTYIYQTRSSSVVEFSGNIANRGGGALYLDCTWGGDAQGQDVTQRWSRYMSRYVDAFV